MDRLEANQSHKSFVVWKKVFEWSFANISLLIINFWLSTKYLFKICHRFLITTRKLSLKISINFFLGRVWCYLVSYWYSYLMVLATISRWTSRTRYLPIVVISWLIVLRNYNKVSQYSVTGFLQFNQQKYFIHNTDKKLL